MKYTIGIVAAVIAVILLSASGYCAYLALTDNVYWGFVMIGIMFPAAVALLIAQAGFSAAQEY